MSQILDTSNSLNTSTEQAETTQERALSPFPSVTYAQESRSVREVREAGKLARRAVSLGAMVRRYAGKDGRRLVQAWAVIGFGTPEEIETVLGKGSADGLKMADRLRALENLADRGWGKAVLPVMVAGLDAGGGSAGTQLDLSRMTDAELEQYRALLLKAGASQVVEDEDVIDLVPLDTNPRKPLAANRDADAPKQTPTSSPDAPEPMKVPRRACF